MFEIIRCAPGDGCGVDIAAGLGKVVEARDEGC